MLGTTESDSVSVDNSTSLQSLLTILMCVAANIKEDEAIKKAEEIIDKKNVEEMNKLLQLYALPRHDLLWESNWKFLQALSYVVAPLLRIFPTMPGLTFKAPITDEAILKNIVKKLQEQLSQKTTEQSQEQLPEKTIAQNPLFEFLDETYREFQTFYNDQEQPNAKIEYQEDDEIHIAVLGTNHVLAKVQLKHLKEKLKNINKNRVHIHLLCKSGQNAVIQEAYGAEFTEDTLGEADEMDKVFKNQSFAKVQVHTVQGDYVGTKPTLEKFYQDYNEQLPENLIFLCCPNTLNRQVADIKLFLAEKQVSQAIQNSIQFLTFSQQGTAEYLKILLEEIKDEKEKEEYIIKFLLKPEIILSSFFAEMAKELYAIQQNQQIQKSNKLKKELTEQIFPKILDEELKIFYIMKSLYENIEFYKEFIKQGNQYSFSSDCHGNLYALLSVLLSSGVVNLDEFKKNIKNFTKLETGEKEEKELYNNIIIFIDRTITTNKQQTISFKEFKEKFSKKNYAEVAKYIPIPNIPLIKENIEKYINMGDNVDRDSLSNVCHIFVQYLISQGLFFIDGNHEKMYKINDTYNIASNGGLLPLCTERNKIFEIQDKFVKEYTGNKEFGDFCYYIKDHSSGKKDSFYISAAKDPIYKEYKNKCGIPNIGTIAKSSGNVIVYPLPLSSITERDEIPEYYVSITNLQETFTVSVNINGTIKVSKINEENIDEKLLSRYEKEIPLEDRKNIIQNLLLCYKYDKAKYPEEKKNEIEEAKKTIIQGLEKGLNTLSELIKQQQEEKKEEEIKLKEPPKLLKENIIEYQQTDKKSPVSTSSSNQQQEEKQKKETPKEGVKNLIRFFKNKEKYEKEEKEKVDQEKAPKTSRGNYL